MKLMKKMMNLAIAGAILSTLVYSACAAELFAKSATVKNEPGKGTEGYVQTGSSPGMPSPDRSYLLYQGHGSIRIVTREGKVI